MKSYLYIYDEGTRAALQGRCGVGGEAEESLVPLRSEQYATLSQRRDRIRHQSVTPAGRSIFFFELVRDAPHECVELEKLVHTAPSIWHFAHGNGLNFDVTYFTQRP